MTQEIIATLDDINNGVYLVSVDDGEFGYTSRWQHIQSAIGALNEAFKSGYSGQVYYVSSAVARRRSDNYNGVLVLSMG